MDPYYQRPMAQGAPSGYFPQYAPVAVTPSPQPQRNIVQLTPVQQQLLGPPLSGTPAQPAGVRVAAVGLPGLPPKQRLQVAKGPGLPLKQKWRRQTAKQEEATKKLRAAAQLARRKEAVLEEQAEALEAEADLVGFAENIERNMNAATNDLLFDGSLFDGSFAQGGIPPLDDSIAEFDMSVASDTGLGAGNIADAFEQPAVHSIEDAAAQTNQVEILDAKELKDLEVYEHPLKNEWVASLPPYDGDLKPGEMCVRDCKERTRIHDLECDEVRRRVVEKLKEMGCPSIAVAIPQKNMCS